MSSPVSLIKTEPTGGHPTWIVKSGAAFLGEITHADTLDWSATAMDGTHFGARSKPKAIQRLLIHAAKATGSAQP